MGDFSPGLSRIVRASARGVPGGLGPASTRDDPRGVSRSARPRRAFDDGRRALPARPPLTAATVAVRAPFPCCQVRPVSLRFRSRGYASARNLEVIDFAAVDSLNAEDRAPKVLPPEGGGGPRLDRGPVGENPAESAALPPPSTSPTPPPSGGGLAGRAPPPPRRREPSLHLTARRGASAFRREAKACFRPLSDLRVGLTDRLNLTHLGGWQRPLSGVLVLSVLSAQTDGLAYRRFFMTCRSGPACPEPLMMPTSQS